MPSRNLCRESTGLPNLHLDDLIGLEKKKLQFDVSHDMLSGKLKMSTQDPRGTDAECPLGGQIDLLKVSLNWIKKTMNFDISHDRYVLENQNVHPQSPRGTNPCIGHNPSPASVTWQRESERETGP